MNRQVGACYSICVAIVIFFAVVLKPTKEAEQTARVQRKIEAARVSAGAKIQTRAPGVR